MQSTLSLIQTNKLNYFIEGDVITGRYNTCNSLVAPVNIVVSVS